MRNKIFVRFLTSLLICAILCCFSSCGKGLFAEEHEFLYEKMNEIPVEYEGYYLENCRSSSDENVFTGKEHAEYVFRDKSLTVNEDNTVIDDRSFMCYAITYEEKEILIDSNFMQERSATYEQINHIWDDKLNENMQPETSEVVGVAVYDEKIFIITCGLEFTLMGSVKGESPYALYYYDIDADTVLYCDFYAGELNNAGGYSGFIAKQYLTIKNK